MFHAKLAFCRLTQISSLAKILKITEAREAEGSSTGNAMHRFSNGRVTENGETKAYCR